MKTNTTMYRYPHPIVFLKKKIILIIFISGAQIMLSMKVIGLGFDISSGVISLPSFTDYMAYIFCAGNVIFGPWISFLDFKSIYSTNISKCLVSYINPTYWRGRGSTSSHLVSVPLFFFSLHFFISLLPSFSLWWVNLSLFLLLAPSCQLFLSLFSSVFFQPYHLPLPSIIPSVSSFLSPCPPPQIARLKSALFLLENWCLGKVLLSLYQAVDWMTKVMKSSFFSVLCLSFSTCFGSWIILDSNYK